jgi:hypothetical protein
MIGRTEKTTDEAGDSEGADPGARLEEAQQVLESLAVTLGTLQEKLESLEQVADDVDGAAISDQSESLNGLSERAASVDHEFKNEDQFVSEEVRDTISSIDDHVHAAGAEAESAAAHISDEQRVLDENLSGLQTVFSDVMERMTAAWHEHLQDLDAARRELSEHVQRQCGEHVAAGRDEIARALGEFSQGVESVMQQLIELLYQAVMDLVEAVEQSVHHAASSRMPTQLALDAVKAVLDPLLKEVRRVKELAESLGLSL